MKDIQFLKKQHPEISPPTEEETNEIIAYISSKTKVPVKLA